MHSRVLQCLDDVLELATPAPCPMHKEQAHVRALTRPVDHPERPSFSDELQVITQLASLQPQRAKTRHSRNPQLGKGSSAGRIL